MKEITIIDYGYGNIFSIVSALKSLGYKTNISNDPDVIRKAELLILPGVGAFKAAIKNLKKLNLDDALKEAIKKGGKIIGICLGYQMLFDHSEEFGSTDGLGLISGIVTKINSNKNLSYKVPNIGWRKLILKNNKFKDINFKNNEMVYFVHSYIPVSSDENKVLHVVKYNGLFLHASVMCEQIIGFQFHPEKSGNIGLSILNKAIRVLE